MVTGARPGIFPRTGNDPGPDRIQLHVANCSLQVIIVKGTGKKAILPEVPASFISSVKTLGIEAVNPAQGFGKVVCCMWKHDEMDMVAHKAVGKNFRSCLFEPFCEEAKVFLPV
jgi:hypothetical protein